MLYLFLHYQLRQSHTLARLMEHAMKKISLTVTALSLVTTLGVGTVALPAQAHAETADLKTTIDTILADPSVAGATTGVVVRKASNGETLYSHNGSSLLIPASNTKLYSSTAALTILGEGYRFRTTVGTTGELNKNGTVVRGDIYIKGRGDPTMQARDYNAMARQLANKGITTIRGQIIADDTYFDDVRLGYNWGWDSNPYYYQPEISALTVAANDNLDTGALLVNISPAAAVGRPARVTTSPNTNYVTFTNNATTGAAGSATSIAVERQMGTNTIVVSGSIAADASPVTRVSTVGDPALYAASLFRDALIRHGVTVTKEAIGRGAMPDTATTLLERDSEPLSAILTPFMKLSNNGIAEILTKTIGQHTAGIGNWPAGIEAMRQVSQTTYGVDINQVKFVDGSGLSNVNLTTPEQTTNLLLAAQQQPIFNLWYNALPIAGMPEPLTGGTLANRMRNTAAAGNVHAKTGSLDNVSALSGYVTTADGERLVFSVMENNYSGASPKTTVEDKIAVALANYRTE
jgi:serine-type D-Ala-D-Ala carboxypeptidase/endopeptidase (penicillin-binding protein 4)